MLDPIRATAIVAITLACTAHASPITTVISVSDVEWTPLNPARGDRSPKAATLWGDRQDEVATGFLVEFAEGFSSPPHIHNVSYRGIVIEGLGTAPKKLDRVDPWLL